ncbi:MAG: hypothetical protein ACKVP0_20570 [Pirellulaceae bacterium]
MSRTPESSDTRHITLARALHARLYVNVEGHIFAADGPLAHEKLAQCLALHDRRPTTVEAPSPVDLGISACDGELSPHLLHDISRALNRWKLELAAESRLRPAKRRKTACLDRERQEIERLSTRLVSVRDWHAQLALGGEPLGAPFFLDPVAERELGTILNEAASQHSLTPLVAWQARVVRWLSGDSAVRRFLAAVVGLFRAYPQVSRCEQVRSFQQQVLVWKQRSEREPIRSLLAEISKQIQRLSPSVVREGQFSARLRGRNFGEHCDLLLNRSNQLLRNDEVQRWRTIPAAVAALAAADGSAVSLSSRCFQAGAEQENFALIFHAISKLAEQIGQPGYDALLTVIDRLPRPPHDHEYGLLRELLSQGSSLEDAAWACENSLFGSLTNSCLNVAAARRLSEAFAERGWVLGAYDLNRLVSAVRRMEDKTSIEAWLGWLACVSRRTITPRILKKLDSAFWNRYLPSVQRHRWFQHLAPCLVPPRRSKNLDNTQPLLERILVYQQIAGKGADLPKSIRKLLEHHDRRRRELEHLRTRHDAVSLDAAAKSRLLRLEQSEGESTDVNSAKLRRVAEEAFLLLGIEAQTAITARLAEAKCREHLGTLVPLLARDQLWDFAGWIEKMSDEERQRLRTVIAARACHGPKYKRHLADNQPWIDKALLQGIDLDPWFAADRQVQTIGGQTMEIVLATELHEIFLMGEYFHTCLSLGDINEMSVLTNAYDVNKQVIFMFTRGADGRREVVARQLIAISRDLKLVGYRCYMAWKHADKVYRPQGLAAMAAYCGRLARRCGLELADQGTPEEIGDHFWYDDSECEWPTAARAAWAANVVGRSTKPETHELKMTSSEVAMI